MNLPLLNARISSLKITSVKKEKKNPKCNYTFGLSFCNCSRFSNAQYLEEFKYIWSLLVFFTCVHVCMLQNSTSLEVSRHHVPPTLPFCFRVLTYWGVSLMQIKWLSPPGIWQSHRNATEEQSMRESHFSELRSERIASIKFKMNHLWQALSNAPFQ